MKRSAMDLVALMVPAILLANGLAGCSGDSSSTLSTSSKSESGLTRVAINQAFENLLYIGLYVAKDAGFFKNEGLNVDVQTGGGDAQAFSALTSGKAEFAQGDPAFVAISLEKGWHGKVIGMVVDRAALWGVTLDDKMKPFTDPKLFKGLTVATFPAPNTSYVIQKQLDQKGKLEVGKDTKILQVVYGTEAAALKSKQCDIAQMLEPNVSITEAQGGKVVVSYPEVFGPLAFTGVTTSDQLIKEKPELVQKFISAYEKGLQYVHSNLEGTVDIAGKHFPTVSRAILKKAILRMINSKVVPEHVAVDADGWHKLLQIRVDTGDLKSVPEDAQVIDNSFAEKAK